MVHIWNMSINTHFSDHSITISMMQILIQHLYLLNSSHINRM